MLLSLEAEQVCVCVHTYTSNTFAKRRCDMTTMTEEYVCAQTKPPGLEEEAMNCIVSKYFVV